MTQCLTSDLVKKTTGILIGAKHNSLGIPKNSPYFAPKNLYSIHLIHIFD